MKNRLLILMFAIGSVLTSCSDAYEIEEKGTLYDAYEAFRTSSDVKSGLNAIYSSIPASTEINLGSVFTDEVSIGVDNGGQGLIQGQYGFNMEAGSGYASSIWGSYYTMINRINRLEVVAKKLISETTDTAEISGLKDSLAELYALRAFAHYKLFAYFTPNYLDNNGMSAIILDHVPPYDYTYSLPRNTVAEVKKFILDDLTRAEATRQSGWADTRDYVSAAMVNAIRVKLYTMTQDWDKVLEYGELIMSQYSLANRTQYRDLFSRVQGESSTSGLNGYKDVPGNTEVIFRLKTTTNSGPSVVSNWYSVRARGEDGSPFYEMGRSLYNELDKLDASLTGTAFTEPGTRNDIRYDVNLVPTWSQRVGTKVLTTYDTASQSDYDSNDLLLIGKYLGTEGADMKNDLHIFRVSDILLCMAEARAAQNELTTTFTDPDDIVGQRTDVYSILYTLRHNRSLNASGISMPDLSSQQAAWKAILNERRVEFAFEGHRYLDMKRLGVRAGSPGFTRYSKDCTINGACNLPVNSYKMTLPIPIGEMNGNKSLTTDSQNPGY